VRCKDGAFAAHVQSRLVPRVAHSHVSTDSPYVLAFVFCTFNGDCVMYRVPHCSHVCGCLPTVYIYLDFGSPSIIESHLFVFAFPSICIFEY
jgi:hypothetical protein